MTIRPEQQKKADTGTLRGEVRLLSYVWRAADGYRLRILFTIVIQILTGLLPAWITYFVQQAITGTEEIGNLLSPGNLLTLMGAILGMTFIKQLSGMIQGYSMANVKRNIERIYVTYLRCNGGPADNRGVIAFSNESEMLTGLIPMVYRSFIQAPLTVVSFLFLMAWISLGLTLVTAGIAAAVVYCCILLRKRVKSTRRILYGRMGDLYQMFSDWLKGYRVVKFYDSEGFLSHRLGNVVDDSCRLGKRLVRMSAMQNIAAELLTYIGVVTFVLAVAYGEHSGEWRILLTYPLAILYIRSEAIKIVQGYTQLTATEASVKHIPKAFRNETAAPSPTSESSLTGTESLTGQIESLRLNGVSFAYEAGHAILNGASATFAKGYLNVIAGESGIGKSTCLDLLSLSLTPTEGSVLINGENAENYNRMEVSERMSLVEQEPFLFEGTFLENLTFGRSYDTEEIIAGCRKLKLSHLISSEADLHRGVSDDGNNLSVGEKQRLVFLRALLKKPDVLLLDEATSSVDSGTAAIMIECIREMASDTLVVCVSHDPEVIGLADQLYVIKNKLITIPVKRNDAGA